MRKLFRTKIIKTAFHEKFAILTQKVRKNGNTVFVTLAPRFQVRNYRMIQYVFDLVAVKFFQEPILRISVSAENFLDKSNSKTSR
jgi:hypothetical protein